MIRKRMSPPNRQDVPQISKELGIHQSTLYKWCSYWRLHGEVVTAVTLHVATKPEHYPRLRKLFDELVDLMQICEDEKAIYPPS